LAEDQQKTKEATSGRRILSNVHFLLRYESITVDHCGECSAICCASPLIDLVKMPSYGAAGKSEATTNFFVRQAFGYESDDFTLSRRKPLARRLSYSCPFCDGHATLSPRCALFVIDGTVGQNI
jgi:hypothetical protein